MKVGLIYTSTTPELIELVEQEVKSSWAMMWSCTACRTPAFWQMFARQAM